LASHGFQLRTQLLTPFGIEKQLQTRTSTDAHVVIALGANVESLLQLRAIEHRITGRALVPETFRHRALLDLGTHDRGDQFISQPVAHLILRSCCGPLTATRTISDSNRARRRPPRPGHNGLWTAGRRPPSHQQPRAARTKALILPASLMPLPASTP